MRKLAERLARQEAEGLIRLPTMPVPLVLLRAKPPKSGKSVLAALLAERAEGR